MRSMMLLFSALLSAVLFGGCRPQQVEQMVNDVQRTAEDVQEVARDAEKTAKDVGDNARKVADTVNITTAFFCQRDPQWKDHPMPNGGTEPIGDSGCLITCAAMILKYNGVQLPSGKALNPGTLVDALSPLDFFVKTGRSAGAMKHGWEPISTLTNGQVTLVQTTYAPAKLDSELANGHPVIIHLPNPAPWGHWVLVIRNESGQYYVHDPYKFTGVNIPIDKATGWGGSLQQIDKMVYQAQ